MFGANSMFNPPQQQNAPIGIGAELENLHPDDKKRLLQMVTGVGDVGDMLPATGDAGPEGMQSALPGAVASPAPNPAPARPPLLSPDVTQGAPESDLPRLQSQLEKVSHPSTKHRILEALINASPAIIGGIVGGPAALGGGLASEEASNRSNTAQQTSRNQLLAQIEREKQRQLGVYETQTRAREGQYARDVAQSHHQDMIDLYNNSRRSSEPTVTIGNKVMQWNPATKRYDIEVGPMKESASHGTPRPRFTMKVDSGIPSQINDDQGNSWDPRDPNLPPDAQKIVQGWDTADATHRQRMVEDQKTVAGYASERQAASAAAADRRMNSQHSFEQEKQAMKASVPARMADETFKELQKLAKQNTSAADRIMLDRIFNLVKPDSGGKMSTAVLDQLAAIGTAPERVQVWAQKIAGRQLFTPEIRREILRAAEVVRDQKVSEGVALVQGWTGGQGAYNRILQGMPQAGPNAPLPGGPGEAASSAPPTPPPGYKVQQKVGPNGQVKYRVVKQQ